MLSPKLKRYSDRIRELIDEGQAVAKLERPSSVGPFIQGEDQIRVQAWAVNIRNIIQTTFGSESPQFHQLKILTNDGVKHLEHSYDIHPIVGLLTGALSDLEKGFFIKQEFIIAGEVFDSVLEQAKYLNKAGHKDPAAILARVVLEDALKRIARSEEINVNQKASQINDELKKIERYPQSQWRLVQAWLDVGNAAAHGRFNEYDAKAVDKLLEDIERFLGSELRN